MFDPSSECTSKRPIRQTLAAWLRERVLLSAPAPGAAAGRLCEDVNLSRAELDTLARYRTDAADELEDLLSALRIDVGALRAKDPATLRDMQRVCTTCRHKARCRHDIAVGAAADRYRDYCPNVFNFDAILQALPERC